MNLLERLLVLYDGLTTPQETGRRAAAFLRETFGCEAVSILQHDRAKDALVFAVVDGGVSSLLHSAIPKGKGMAWWAFENGFVVVRDTTKDPRFFELLDATSGFTTRNLIALPFGYQGQTMGVIELLNVPEDRIAAPKIEMTLKVVAGHVGVALAASTLSQRLIEKSRRLRDANATLEATVAERTAALEHALGELRNQNDVLQNFQSQLIQTEKMAALGQLAAGVAHEINNPTGFIASNLATAKKYWGKVRDYTAKVRPLVNPETEAAYRERYDLDHVEEDMGVLIDECLEGTARVTTIVKNLKEFAHQGKNEASLVDVKTLIEHTLSIAMSPYKHNVTIKLDLKAPPELVCNAQDLGQVLLNLIVNAGQAIMPRQGTITLASFVEGPWYVIEVADTGSGIAEENLARIFEPFFTTKPVGEGTGLGLSLCFRMVKKAGGQIIVRSKVGAGTTFRIELPAGGAPQADPP